MLCHAFHRGELPEFFATARPGRREQPKKRRDREQIIALRKRNYSVYEISQALNEQGIRLSATAVREVAAEASRLCGGASTRSIRLASAATSGRR